MSEAITANAVGAVADLARDKERAESRVEVVALPNDPRNRYLLVRRDADGTVHREEMTPPPPLRRHEFATVDAFIDYAKQYANLDDSAIFYDIDRLTLLYSEDDDRERATLKLRLSPQFRLLREFEQRPQSHAAFVKTLRVTLRGCMPDSIDLLKLIRKVDFKVNADAQSDVQHASRGMGIKAQSRVETQNELPEELTLTVPVWDNHNFKVVVTVYFDIDTDAMQFKLLPFPQELDKAERDALDTLLTLLDRPELPPAFQGSAGGHA